MKNQALIHSTKGNQAALKNLHNMSWGPTLKEYKIKTPKQISARITNEMNACFEPIIIIRPPDKRAASRKDPLLAIVV